MDDLYPFSHMTSFICQSMLNWFSNCSFKEKEEEEEEEEEEESMVKEIYGLEL